MNQKKKYTRKDLYADAMAHNKALTVEYLEKLSLKALLGFVSPDLRNEIKELGITINF